MQLVHDHHLITSATDITNFLECEHLTQLELAAARGELTPPVREDPEGDVVRRRGLQHEQRYLDHLKEQGRQVVEIRSHSGDATSRHIEEHEQTLAAMRQGAEVIYQGTFFGNGWLGHADFLIRVDTSSALGAWSYEVADTKLARSVKVGALLQMCAYSEQLAASQGLEPEHMHVVLGDMTVEIHRLADYSAYYRSVKDRFLAAINRPPADTYPNKVGHCSLCRWNACCEQRRRDDDHLSLVANLNRAQTRKLAAAGIPTVAVLASSEDVEVKGIGDHTLQRLRQQAQLQLKQRQTEQVHFEVLPPDGADRGLCALPLPDDGDLFFDMEGDPWVGDEGLEYLFGVAELVPNPEAGGLQPDGSILLRCEIPVYGPEGERYRREFPDMKPEYRAFWAHDPAEEKRAFEAFIDFVMERLAVHPGLHIYHYAPYEPHRMKRLMGRYGTREDEVDRLLRGGVFVDLYQVVRQGIRISQESYSIKKLEPLYMEARETAIKEGGSSIVAYEQWLESQEPGILQDLEDYNRDDCVSTWRLRDWLEERRLDAQARYGELARPGPRNMEPTENQQVHETRTASLVAALMAGVSDERSQRSEEQQGRWLLAQLLGWHRREDRPEWWAYFERLQKTDEELLDDPDSIGGLTYEGVVDQVKRSLVHRYRFNPEQEHKVAVGARVCDPRTAKSAGDVTAIDNVNGTVDLKRGANSNTPNPTSLVPQSPLNNTVLRNGLARCADSVADRGLHVAGPYQAAADLLLRRPPRMPGLAPGAHLQIAGESGHDAARRLAVGLDGGTLAVQGPPGSGKTYTAARMIVDLIRVGKRVGIAAFTHKAIGNLLDELCRAADDQGLRLRAIQKAGADEQCASDRVDCTDSNAVIDNALTTDAVDVVAGTAWLFAREELAGKLDALFIDEAGQMSLANVIAMSGSARNLILLGDPQQLPQVTKGTHPLGAGGSALAHLLDDRATIPADMGIFLGTTWRLHPEICRFVSETSYEGRLEADPSCSRQALDADLPSLQEAGDVTGLHYLPTQHEHNRSFSREEVALVASLVGELESARWVSANGARRPLRLQDILVVAPYNAQVARLGQGLPADVEVGTVDKFQGREAPVVIYSLATSSADDLPRNVEFLYSLNRLNVAVSRARGMAVLICSPALLSIRCQTPQQMRLANGLCRFVELAGADLFKG